MTTPRGRWVPYRVELCTSYEGRDLAGRFWLRQHDTDTALIDFKGSGLAGNDDYYLVDAEVIIRKEDISMAANIVCDNHSELAAFFMITMIPEAETVALCLDCGADWAQGLIQAMRPELIVKPPAAAPRKRKPRSAAAAAANGKGEQVTADAAAGQGA